MDKIELVLAEQERTERAAISIGSAAVVQELEESYAPRTSLQVSGQLYNLKKLGENFEDVARWIEFSKCTCKVMGSIPN